jgi:ABC-type transport system substrate-binding protein
MSKEIILDDKFSIEADSNNWTLYYREEKTKKDGKPYTAEEVWYTNSLRNCLNRYTNEALKVAKTPQELMDRLEQVEKTIIRVTSN